MPGLDGLRALAVVAVLLYHAGLTWLPGGFLGVEVFFVISGYLITALLLAEWRQRGRVDLKAFWMGRARRLFPAAYLLIAVTLAFAVVFLPGEVAGLRGDALAAFGYATNWYLVIGQESYFEAVGRPSLLRHLWSLAVEEQFYVLWPVLLTAIVGAGATRYRRRRVLFVLLAGAAASASLMALLYAPDADPSRLYYGTDTRAAGLLVGAALAVAWGPGLFRAPREEARAADAPLHLPRVVRRRGRFRRRWGWMLPLLLDVVGLGALCGLVWASLHLGEYQPFLYRGGFLSVALVTALVIIAVVHPHTRLGNSLLGWRPLRWIGLRSYGIYLWHWPVFMVTRPELDVPIDGWPLLISRLAATVVLADLSYRYVEMPIRKGALERSWKALRKARGPRRRQLGARWAGATGMIVTLSVMLGVAVVHAEPPAPPSYLSSMKAIHTEAPATEKNGQAEKTAGTTPDRAAAQGAESKAGSATTAAVAEPKKTAPVAAQAPVGRVTAIGDSVMLGAAPALSEALPTLDVMDAEVGTQVSTGIEILRARRAAGQLGEVVVVHLGNNGTFTPEQFDEMMGVLEGTQRVVFVNVKVPRPWEGPNNAAIDDGVRRHPNAVLVDWRAASIDRPGLFWDDGMHLRPEGQRAYADLVEANLHPPAETAATKETTPASP